MNSREVVFRTVRFQHPDRLAYTFPEQYGTDIIWVDMDYNPDVRRSSGVDEWGAVWRSLGTKLGEVIDFPIKTWEDLEKIRIPDIHDPSRWQSLPTASQKAGDKFLLGNGISIYERVHFLRGLHNTWMDIYEAPAQLERLLDLLTDMNIAAVEHYAKAGVNGLIFCDDWGLQNRLMISPTTFRKLWKPRYARIYEAAHQAEMLTFLHSCGYIVEILDDLIEAGLDVIQMDQQENMGLHLLGERFGGRITFWCPVDIQNTMVYGSLDEIRMYCRKLVHTLGRPEGGFIAAWYSDPVSAGHRPEAIQAMCQAFLEVSQEIYGGSVTVGV